MNLHPVNRQPAISRRKSTCPHDCPSTCALDVEVLDGAMIGRVRGSDAQSYTAGVICAKVARYAERNHHPDRLLKPLQRVGEKGAGDFREISWEAALDELAEAFVRAETQHGSEAVWPYHYAGTMGLVQRDGIHRLRNLKGYSGQFDTICVNMAWTGYWAGTGKLAGPDPREMAKSDCIVIWGTNAVSTQVNVMTHATRARKERGAKIVVIDVYNNDTMKQADLALCLNPGSDGALACAVMHCLFRDGHADRDYMAKYADCPGELEAHLKSRGPQWAAPITGLSVQEIEAFAALLGERKRAYLRLGYGFTRSRNGAVNMHAALSIATVMGSWPLEGGGAFHNNAAIYNLNNNIITAADRRDPAIRMLDQSRIGQILTGDADALLGGPPVLAMLIQNTNPVSVAPEQTLVKQGFARDDLFVCVHEQFMTETAKMADIVLPATMFTEHDDIYRGGGHQYLSLGPKLIDGPGETRENHYVHCELMKRLGVEDRANDMSACDLIDAFLKASKRGSLEALDEKGWIDCQPDFDTAHYVGGFHFPDRRFRFAPDWPNVRAMNSAPMGPYVSMPRLPDHWDVTENADAAHPFRLVTAPVRSFLNSTFNETPGSIAREGRPHVMVHPEDASALSIADGAAVILGNERGQVRLHAKYFEGVCRGVVVSEGLWPNDAFVDGNGINTLTGADPAAPFGGAAFHDNHVWLRPVPPAAGRDTAKGNEETVSA
ncbi:MAG: molybdopterin oxidoreductase family protein [Rhodobiaceae bacterium]|nr:molybdopterin oxidoreductase family protein [Rhodobiaceae bacterium]MCC0053013.1 molybdopterin oxidoreductase family protein [Rhodobiaceae bacterium]